MISLYNTLTGKKQPFHPLDTKNVGMYNCGPTIYDFAHIGNWRSFLFADLVRRFFELEGFTVKQVMNITDVDDKTIAGAQKMKKPLHEFTDVYYREFLNDLGALRIKRPHVLPRATDHIGEMITLIERLLERGLAYKEKDGSVYFDISAFPQYGRLVHLNPSTLKENARLKVDQYERDEARDFALWKGWTSEDGAIAWDASFGKGRPGWHIECSAMSMKYLGATFDVHTGGIDLRFPHHENELAQSVGATNHDFARVWLHNEHLLVDGKKMSKSLGNYHTLRDILEKGFEPVAFRYLCLSTHYRTQMNFTFKSLENAAKTVANVNSFMHKVRDTRARTNVKKENQELIVASSEARQLFLHALEDDLNTPIAVATIFELMNVANRHMDEATADSASLDAVLDTMSAFNAVFDVLIDEEPLSPDDEKLVVEREHCRKKKDFAKADHIRDLLKRRGILLEDTPYGVIWRRSPRRHQDA